MYIVITGGLVGAPADSRLKEIDEELEEFKKLAGFSDIKDVYRKSKFGKNPINTVRTRLGPHFLGEPEESVSTMFLLQLAMHESTFIFSEHTRRRGEKYPKSVL